MPDYKEMYLQLFRATEIAVRALLSAQQRCEDVYISSPETVLEIFPENHLKPDEKDSADE